MRRAILGLSRLAWKSQRTADDRIDFSTTKDTKITKNGFSFVIFVSLVVNRFRPDPLAGQRNSA
jgi:hypothetical protein